MLYIGSSYTRCLTTVKQCRAELYICSIEVYNMLFHYGITHIHTGVRQGCAIPMFFPIYYAHRFHLLPLIPKSIPDLILMALQTTIFLSH